MNICVIIVLQGYFWNWGQAFLGDIKQGKSLILIKKSGGPDETRTRDLRRDRPAF